MLSRFLTRFSILELLPSLVVVYLFGCPIFQSCTEFFQGLLLGK
jgi:hypothetical protein